MDITAKLRLIQEGYSIDQINSPDFTPFHSIEESSILPDYIYINSGYVTEMAMGIMQESSNGIMTQVGKFFAWLWEKVKQFIKFIKNKFTPNTKDRNSKLRADVEKLKDKVSEIKKVNYEMTVWANVYDKNDEDFLKNGIEKVFNIIFDRAEAISTSSAGIIDSKVTNLNHHDVLIDNEQKFLDSVFNEAFKTSYSEKAIMDTIYGPTKKVTVLPAEITTKMLPKLKHLEIQQLKFIQYVGDFIPKALQSFQDMYSRVFDNISKSIEESKQEGDLDSVHAQSKFLHIQKANMSKVVKVFNYLFKVADQFLAAHKTVTLKFGDAISQIVDDMEGRIKLEAKK